MVRILGFHCHGPGSIPGGGTEILKAMWEKGGRREGGKEGGRQGGNGV